jgi:signal peptidase I
MRILWLVFLGGMGALFLRLFVVEGIVIASGSMEPTLFVGRHIFVNKMAYWSATPERGDIVVFPSPVDEKKDLVKRVIAVPGDDVQIFEKKIHLNGKPLEEPYARFSRQGEMLQGDNMEVGRVPMGKVFVLGDNRDVSNDSRDWVDRNGKHIYFVEIDRLKGKLIGI